MNTVNRQNRRIEGTAVRDALQAANLARPVHGDGSQYHYSPGLAWDVKYDGSAGWEVASPALAFDDDGENGELRDACAALAGLNPAIDTKCGLHVSIFCRDFTWKDLQRLHAMWIRYESFFFDMLPSSRAQRPAYGPWYCQPLNEGGIYEPKTAHWTASQAAVTARTSRDFQRAVGNIGKYASMNMQTWWSNGRVEFRLHSGTIDYEKIRNFTLLLCAFVERAIAQRTVGMTTVKVALPTPAPIERRKGWNSDYILTLVGLAGPDAHSKSAVLKAYCDERRAKFGLARRKTQKRDGTLARLVAEQRAAAASFGGYTASVR